MNPMKIFKKLSHYQKLLLASFLLPSVIIFTVYLTQGIYWNSPTSPLLGDGYHQYVIFDIALSNALHQNQHLLYNFTSGLGINFYALTSYYLGSFLSPLVYFFDNQSMPDALYLLTIVKFGLIGLTTAYSLSGIFKKVSYSWILMFSTSFSLMSFSTSQLEIKNWLDVFILFPLIIYGLHQLVNQGKRRLYFISLTLVIIQNYYFAYMICLFLPIWYLLQVSWDFKNKIRSLLDFILTSLLSVLASSVMLMPTILDLRTHGENFTNIDKFVNPDGWYLDFFAKNLVGVFDTTKYGSIPMVYIGLLSLLLALTFFFIKEVKFHVKLLHLSAILFFILSFKIQALDLFWQGMHAPNMFLHRYSWLLSFLILYLAAETISRIQTLRFYQFFLSTSLLTLALLACLYYKKEYPFISEMNLLLSLEFLFSYLFIFWLLLKKKISYKWTYLASLCFLIFELAINSYYQVEGIAQEWVFSSRSAYQANMRDINTLVDFAEGNQDTFFRTERLHSQTGNDSMKYNYKGISQFSSVRNTQSSSVLDQLGFLSAGTNLNLRYQNNSILMDSLFGVSYNLSSQNPQKFGFQKVNQSGKMSLYQNQYANQLAFLTADRYKDVNFDYLTLDNQKRFLNQLSGLELNYFSKIPIEKEENIIHQEDLVLAKKNPANDLQDASLKYWIEVPAHQQVYLTIPELVFSNDDKDTVNITVNNQTSNFTTNNVFPFFNIGYFEEKQLVEVFISFPENKEVSFQEPQFYGLSIDSYQKVFAKLQEQKVTVTENKKGLEVNYQAQKDTSLFITLPYDKGWKAYQNGKEVPISRAQKGFMKIDVKKGKSRIELQFIPQGLQEGAIISLTALLTFISYDYLRSKIRKKKLG